MKISYNKLWKLLIDRKLKIKDLQEKTKKSDEPSISSATFAKMKKGGNINTKVIVRICEVLKCDVCHIMEIVE